MANGSRLRNASTQVATWCTLGLQAHVHLTVRNNTINTTYNNYCFAVF